MLNATIRGRRSARFDISAVALADTQEDMERMWDAIYAALDAIPGLLCQGGASGFIDPADVVAGSPLAAALSTTEAPDA